MNSQDNPTNSNERFDESAANSDSIQPEEKDVVDLWTKSSDEAEVVTEFISVEKAQRNDAEALDEIEPTVNLTATELEPKSKAELDLDDWDFRNLDSTELDSQPDEDADADIDEFIVDELESTNEAEVASDVEIDEFPLVEMEEEAQPEISLSTNELEPESEIDPQPVLLDSEPIMNELEPESEIDPQPVLLDSEPMANELEPELEIDPQPMLLDSEPIAEVDLDLSLEDPDEPVLAADDLGMSLAGLELDSEPDALLELDLTIDSQAEIDLELVNETDPLSVDSDLPELDLETLDSSNTSLEVGELGDLDSLAALDDDSLDSLSGLDDNLDDLLSLDTESDSLDALELEPAGNLDALEDSLNNDMGSLDLDSLLESEPQAAPAPINIPSVPSPQPAVAQAAAPAPMSAKSQAYDQTMRVSVRKLDNLNNLIGELVVKRNRLEDDQERLRHFLDNLLGHVQSLGEAGAKMHDMYERSLLEGALMASRQSRANSAVAAGVSGMAGEKPQEEGLDALEMDRFTGFHLLSQEIIELIVRVREAASDIQFVVDETDKVAQTFRQVTGQLQDGMNSSRMVAFGQTADRLPRAVRDISRKQKKQTKLHVEGKEVLIDKMIVEHIYNPMTHLVNNAISHGIEPPEVRLKHGKTEVGNVYIRAFIQGNQTVITVRDDGAGIDPVRVKQKAVEKNIISWAAAQNLSEQQVYELLFHPGFSTKDEADDFAGRGVGMDVVNTDLKKIRGSVSTESKLGEGTTFTIRLPLVLSICKALTCVDNSTKIAFPIDGVEDTKEYLPSDIQTNANGVRCIEWNEKVLPLRPLSGLLNYNRQIRRTGIYNANQNNDDMVSVVILRSLDNLLAIEVDEVRAEQEIVIKQIDGPVAKPPGIAGATVLGDGSIMPIGDVLELVEIAQGKRTIEIGFNILAGAGDVKQAQAESIQQEPMVLVVDDSITVRELLSMSFNKLGYRVEQARDGQEAWDKLRGGLVCDMIFSDIEMPRMNGLELLSNLHQDSELKSIPVAMLTSRGADKHRQIANDLGAKAYLTKPYTEKDLMDVAQHLIEINRANQQAESDHLKANQANSKADTSFEDAPLVLIIDDSVTVRELLSMTFRNAGYRVEQARDGQEAWEKLNDGLECDLAFCDIEMPRMNGLELLSQLQKDEKLAALPIAMLTSRGAQKMRNIAASRGANGYFVKPYVEDDLLKAAERMMNGEMLIEDTEN
ncbi:MAG: response regulator [Cyanobacteria bacterium J06648_1]